ncbi:hypothetical protein BJ992_006392 [Sphaerisporangium rubeum]|uniref:Uncharacterized protein n=1 Tax=Sphaerisporangium rubeum TaxID=321317 RepID=A0A7X0MBC9_9ACTN|nr:hypothetical protein [Sphaerisporangium rubeum]
MDEMAFITLTGEPFFKLLYQSKSLKIAMTDKPGK